MILKYQSLMCVILMFMLYTGECNGAVMEAGQDSREPGEIHLFTSEKDFGIWIPGVWPFQVFNATRNFYTPDDLLIKWQVKFRGSVSREEVSLMLAWFKPDGTLLVKTEPKYYSESYNCYTSLFYVDDLIKWGGKGKWNIKAYDNGVLIDNRYFYLNEIEELDEIPIANLKGVTDQKHYDLMMNHLRKDYYVN